MHNNLDSITEMIELIKDELSNCEFGDYDCKNCPELEICYHKASVQSSHEFAKSLNYGGYDTEEEFWDNLD